jgi:hypothetical protein
MADSQANLLQIYVPEDDGFSRPLVSLTSTAAFPRIVNPPTDAQPIKPVTMAEFVGDEVPF